MLRRLIMSALLAPAISMASPQVFLIGDSTMADKPADLPEWGWGMAFPRHFKNPASVKNHAVNGRSTKSFLAEGRWKKVQDGLKAGDFVVIQFGHNDEKIDKPAVGTDPATTFRDNLRRFVRETRARDASPILATPVCRRVFGPDGKLKDTHGAYPDAVRAVAAEEKVPLLDLEKSTAAWLQAEGDEPSKKFFMWIRPDRFAKLPEGSKDNTHFVEAGALRVAELAVKDIRDQKLPISQLLK